MSPLVKARRNRLLMAFIGLGILLAVLAPSNFAQNRPIPVRPTDIPREEVAPVIPTEAPQPEVIPTDVPAVEPEQPQQPEQPANEGNNRPIDRIDPLLQETFCRLNINNGGDTNPFSFQFVATGSANIVGYAWDVNAPSAIDSTAATYNHTYPAAGTYNVSLTCTPTTGAPLTLTGVVTVSAPVVAAFYFPDGNQYDGVPPFTVDAINASTGSGLTYTWRLSGSSDPLDPGIVPDVTTTDYSPTITSADFVAAGFGADGPAIIYFHLTVEDPVSGLSAVATRSVSFVPPPPLYDFTLTPSDGQAPLAVTVNVVALPGSGPVDPDPATAFQWTFTGGTPASGTGASSGTTYTADGLYTVVLNYFGPGGGGSVTKSVNVFVDGEPVEAQFSYEIIGGSGPIQVCFNNESTGPIINSEWDFESDGNPVTFDVVDNAPVVCFDYPTGGFKTVQLVVRDQDHVTSGGVSGSSSSATLSFDLTASPIAAFTFAPTSPIVQGTLVNFTDQSDTTGGGPVDTWEWDFNGDGVTDSTAENPTNIPFNQIGGNVIRLTVTGPGGSSFVEQIIQVNRLEIVCAIGGPGAFNVLPTAGGQTYTANITNALGRPITYTWTVTGTGAGLPINQSGASNTLTVDWSTVGFGSFQVSLVASTADGSVCDASRTVTRLWTPLDCTMTNTLPSPIYPTGGTATFTAAHGSTLNGRPIIGYEWFLDNVSVQTGPSNTYTYTIPNSSAIVSEPHSVRYVVIVDNTATAPGYTPATATCEETTNFTVVGWPTLVCASIGGSATPVPVNADTGNPQTQNYTANITGVAGRTVTYTWTVSDGTITTPNPRTNNNQATVQWNTTAGSLAPAPANDSISVVVNITNPDGTPVTCNMARNNISVTYNRLVCQGPFGDTNVVVGEFANHSYTFGNSYGRDIVEIVWTLQQESTLGAGDWVTIDTLVDNTAPFDAYTNYQFNTPDASYRLSYTAIVAADGAIPGDNCASGFHLISTYGTGVGFECESGLVGATNVNTTPPFNAGATYVYYIDMDNSNLLPLQYVWTLTDADGAIYTLRSFINSANANIYSTNDGIAANGPLSLAELGPIGPGTYTLTVTITDSSGSTAYTCNRSATLQVGFVDALYSYTIAGGWTNTALPVNTEICLTNTSTHAPTAPASHPVQYLWTVELVGGGTQTFTTENIACFSYTTPGTYTVTVQISTADGTPSDTYSLDFSVYGIQTISIGRTAPVSDFSASQSFNSNGTNLTGQYNWVFDRLTPTSNPA
ncbi:MAG: PKD domain-containing protein, partial [Anaerolineae bacterium]|nr:PKD domain-containing protein [Anaerolineae bacterium]